MSDLRYALRSLRRSPGFTTIALFTLALGVGATTAIFTVVSAVVLEPLPYPQADRLIAVYENEETKGWPRFSVSAANFLDWARLNRTFESMAAVETSNATLSGHGATEEVTAQRVSADYFTVLGVQPAVGRVFAGGEDMPGSPRVVVLGHAFWQATFRGDRSVAGRAAIVDGEPATIVGVMPPGFGDGANPTAIWTPLALNRSQPERGGRTLFVVGRLRNGVALDAARSDLKAIAARLERDYPASNRGWSVTLVPLRDVVVGDAGEPLMLLLGAAGCLLLVACVNVSNLLLARGAARAQEIAVRSALGADRATLALTLLSEGAAIALAGGVAGIFVAVWGVELLRVLLAAAGIPRIHEVDVDLPMIAFGLAATGLSILIAAVLPALRGSRSDVQGALMGSSRSATASVSRTRVRRLLVIGEVALALILLTGAGLFIRSFLHVVRVDLGLDPRDTLTFRLQIPEARYARPDDVNSVLERVLERLRALPGVTAAGATHALPFSGMASVRPFVRESDPDQAPTSQYRLVTPGYFRALGLPIVRGRDFEPRDMTGPGAVILNEAFVRRFWRDGDPVGRRLRQGGNNPAIPWLTVVGIARDVRHFGPTVDPQPEMYWLHNQATWGATLNRLRRQVTVVVRGAATGALARAVTREVAAIDPQLAVGGLRPLSELLSTSIAYRRALMLLIALFAGVAVLLATVGVYGVMSSTMAERTREVGIRLALGAAPQDVMRLLVGKGFAMTAIGVAGGLAGISALRDVVAGHLFRVQPLDVIAIGAACTLLAGAALVACWVPARRAASISPVAALRSE
jgi:predicted permease